MALSDPHTGKDDAQKWYRPTDPAEAEAGNYIQAMDAENSVAQIYNDHLNKFDGGHIQGPLILETPLDTDQTDIRQAATRSYVGMIVNSAIGDGGGGGGGNANYAGEWNPSTSYSIGDVVGFRDSLWEATSTNISVQPGEPTPLDNIPGHNNFANAGTINMSHSGAYYYDNGINTATHTTEPGEPLGSSGPNVPATNAHSRWWKITPGTTGRFYLSIQPNPPTTNITGTYTVWKLTGAASFANLTKWHSYQIYAGGSGLSSGFGQSDVGQTFYIQVAINENLTYDFKVSAPYTVGSASHPWKKYSLRSVGFAGEWIESPNPHALGDITYGNWKSGDDTWETAEVLLSGVTNYGENATPVLSMLEAGDYLTINCGSSNARYKITDKPVLVDLYSDLDSKHDNNWSIPVKLLDSLGKPWQGARIAFGSDVSSLVKSGNYPYDISLGPGFYGEDTENNYYSLTLNARAEDQIAQVFNGGRYQYVDFTDGEDWNNYWEFQAAYEDNELLGPNTFALISSGPDGNGPVFTNKSGSLNLTLGADPEEPMHAVTKQYVDSAVGTGGGGTTGSVPVATGGSESNVGSNHLHTFTTNGNLVVSQGGTLEYLIIAGGGGGGGSVDYMYGAGGGGGAGGLLRGVTNVEPGTYAVVVGSAGAGGSGGYGGTGSAARQGNNGGDSSFNSIVASGGGGGGTSNDPAAQRNGLNGGSGGGAGWSGTGGSTVGGAQGTSGGRAISGDAPGGGGGGSGSAGGEAGAITSATGGAGGSGTTLNWTGSDVIYAAGGGGGGGIYSGPGGPPGSPTAGGGGSNGGGGSAAGYGNGGGGGGGAYARSGGNGSQGLVIIRYGAPITQISTSVIDAKGDLIVGTTDNTVDRLGVGTNGQVLTADASAASGVKWGAPALVVVTHGANGSMTRPVGAAVVYWVGTATPTNALPYDFWKDT